MGDGEISKLIAWASNSLYSHSALVLDAETVIEAAGSGVRTTALAQRLANSKEFSLIDSYRFGGAKGGLITAQLSALQTQAKSFLGDAYPLDELFELGVVCALRSKLDWPEPLKWLLRIALDHVVHTDPTKMVCSEFIYRSYAEAPTNPAGALRPTIEVVEAPQRPFPDISWLGLLKEYEEARHAAPRLPPAPTAAPALRSLATQTVVAPDIAAQAEHIRQRRSATTANTLATVQIVDPWPNPATVTPQDFADSPSFGKAARLLPSI